MPHATRSLPILLLVLLTQGCGGHSPVGAADRQQPFPDLGGRTVMLLPVQDAVPTVGLAPGETAAPLGADDRAALESELAYWVTGRAARVRWIGPDAVEAAVRRTPVLEVNVRQLTVRDFQRARLEFIGDPLYGELRRVAALLDARAALLPIGAVQVRDAGGGSRIHLALALIDTFGGDVVWYGVVAGAPSAPGDAAATASVAQALAELIPQ